MDSPNRPQGTWLGQWAKRLGLLGALSSAALLSGCTQEDLRIGFFPRASQGATSHTEAYTDLWVNGWIVTLIVGFVAWGLILWCLVAYRRRRKDRGLPVQLAYNMPIEILYTIAPIILIMGFFVASVDTINKTVDDKTPGKEKIQVIGKQWSWDFNYVTEDAYFAGVQANLNGTEKPGREAPTLYLPENTDLEIELLSRDVIHSFWVPAFLEKRDMIPGHPNTLHFKALKKGLYVGKCAELCGEFHSEMLFNVRVVSMDEFKSYTKGLREKGNKGQLGTEYDRTQWYQNPYKKGEEE